MDKARQYLGIARKAGLLILGEDNCGTVTAQGRAKLFLLASDASPNTRKRAVSFLRGHRAPLMTLPWTREDLSQLLGKKGCGMMCLTDLPLAVRFAEAMAEGTEEWQETAALLSRRADKAARRKAAGPKHDSREKRRT